MSAERWDAIVLGGGPAGALAARGLALRGRRVLVVERSAGPRTKVCGSCLHASGLEVLARVGLSDVVTDAPRLVGASIHAAGRAVRLDLPAAGRVVARDRFDERLLAAAAEAGATVERGASGTTLDDAASPTVRITSARGSRDATATVLVDARGLGSDDDVRVAPRGRIGVGALSEAPAPPSGVTMACGRHGYVGLVALGDGRVDVAGALDAPRLRALRGDIGRAVAEVLDDAGVTAPLDVTALRWSGTPTLTRRPASVAPAGERRLRVGDAAGYVEPFTGEGMAWALATGAEVVDAADALIGGARGDVVEASWRVTHRRLLGARHRHCGAVARLLRSPTATRWAVTALARWPGLASGPLRWSYGDRASLASAGR